MDRKRFNAVSLSWFYVEPSYIERYMGSASYQPWGAFCMKKITKFIKRVLRERLGLVAVFFLVGLIASLVIVDAKTTQLPTMISVSPTPTIQTPTPEVTTTPTVPQAYIQPTESPNAIITCS